MTAALALAAILAIADVGRTPTGHPRGISEATAPAEPPPKPSSYAVGLDVMRLVEPGRTIQLPNGESEPRTLVTYVRYPALGSPTQTDVAGA
ncbi:MAG: hypothetical protein KGJ43_09240, partial [Acidobacteriota bacterium]|nr:hypothetical protein [Acidobacteriota bacterium]